MHLQDTRGKVASLAVRSRSVAACDVDVAKIRREGFQIIRGFGADAARLELELNRVSKRKLFHSACVGGVVHQFRVLPYSENLSEQRSGGGYHTDFMFQPRPPEFVALLCIRPDPRHPFYGRNQVVHRDAFLERIRGVFGITEAELLNLPVKYNFTGRAPIVLPLLHRLDGERIFKLHTSLMQAEPVSSFSDLPLKAAIEALCGDIAQEIVLDSGDLLIVSNHCALRRRSECTVAFEHDGRSFQSRELATIRFDV